MTIETLSGELAAVVEANAESVVRVEGRPRGASSGVVWSAEGIVLASHHAVDMEEAPVGLADGRTVPAKVVGRDPGRDLVVLRVDAPGIVPPRWGAASEARVGQLVVGLSRPGRAVRAQLGIVSAVAGPWRAPSGGRLERYLESDLALHPGFSGGLLLGVDGAGLGANTAGLLRGTSLAVPAETLRLVVEAVLARGRVRRGYLGIGTQPVALTSDLRGRLGQTSALIVLSVQPESPAARAGLLLGDVLLKAGGEALTHPGALLPALDEERVGQEVGFEVLRAGQNLSVPVVVGERTAG
ncbi:MAG TPA: trypsin-like peptidase domain-containing protein [Vicinamibacteria bacterium]|nr:trypsin-like peptidase domain-containing protein [Vicinamibacteria bacterium]